MCGYAEGRNYLCAPQGCDGFLRSEGPLKVALLEVECPPPRTRTFPLRAQVQPDRRRSAGTPPSGTPTPRPPSASTRARRGEDAGGGRRTRGCFAVTSAVLFAIWKLELLKTPTTFTCSGRWGGDGERHWPAIAALARLRAQTLRVARATARPRPHVRREGGGRGRGQGRAAAARLVCLLLGSRVGGGRGRAGRRGPGQLRGRGTGSPAPPVPQPGSPPVRVPPRAGLAPVRSRASPQIAFPARRGSQLGPAARLPR